MRWGFDVRNLLSRSRRFEDSPLFEAQAGKNGIADKAIAELRGEPEIIALGKDDSHDLAGFKNRVVQRDVMQFDKNEFA